MIAANPSRNGHVVSTLEGKRVEFTINLQGGHIMDVLAGLYTDREMAVLREYATNAWDAHRAVGQKRPIEVTLPSELEPQLVIRDYGIGLSVDDITGILTQFGSSTKTDTNEQTGMLGLGFKSAFAYTNHFNLVSVRDGVQATVMISKTGDAPSLTVVDTCTTDEQNGTTVTIPCNRINNFRWKAERLFRFWDEGSVLVNGKAPARVEGLKVGDNMLVIEGDTDYVVMGNVPYPTKERLNTGLPPGKALVAFVPIGSVEFAPSREGLKDTKFTTDRLEEIGAEFTALIEKAVADAISKAANHREAIKITMDWHKLSSRMSWPKYRGVDLPKSIDGSFLVASWDKPRWGRGLGADRVPRIEVSYTLEALFVYGYDLAFSKVHRDKLKMYCRENNLDVKYFLLSEDNHSKNVWLKDAHHVDWKTIKALRLPKPATTPGARGNWNVKNGPSGSYDHVWTKAGQRNYVMASEIDTTKPIYYVTKDTINYQIVARALAIHTDCTVVFLTNNRITKFCRDFPKAKTPEKAYLRLYERLTKRLTEKDMVYRAMTRVGAESMRLKALDATRIKDPEIRKALRTLDAGPTKRYDDWNGLVRPYGATSRPPAYDYKSPLKKYKLLDRMYSFQPDDHMYIYLNAAYAAEKDNNR